MITRVRGTQDQLDLTLYNFVLNNIKKHLTCYNFSEIKTPILEYTKLFSHSLGIKTDVVSKEMYIFPAEKKEDSICLRPEATASTIRAYIENRIEEKPWKVFSFGPMFRYERPQKGRWRQFNQINMEIINTSSIAQDANFIKMIDSFFNNLLKLETYILKINFLGCLQDRINHRKQLNEFLDTLKTKICSTCKTRKATNILRIFDCKNPECQALYKNAPKLTDNLCETCNKEWFKLQELLQILSVNHIHDPYLVRGLDYYNKTVFEFASDELGAQNAFCGGGRYTLGKEIGGEKNIPSIGAAIGIGRLLLLLDIYKDKLALPQKPALNLILPITIEQENLALLLADELYSQNICTDILLEGTSLKSMLRKANKMGAQNVLILGEDEQKNGTVNIKNMQTGENKILKQMEVGIYLKK